MNEKTQAKLMAERALDVPYADPDDDLRTISRQFLRALEREAALSAAARCNRCAADLCEHDNCTDWTCARACGKCAPGPALSAAPAPRMFPIQKATPIPWSLAERAYRTYAEHYGRQQSLERLAERGGFGWSEFLHLYYDDTTYAKKEEMQARWDADELAQAKLRIAELEKLVAAPARDGVREALERLSKACTALGQFKGDKTLYELNPIKDQNAYEAWVELDAAQKQAQNALAAKEQADGQG